MHQNEYGPPKTHYNRWKRWRDMGIFAWKIEEPAAAGGARKTIMGAVMCPAC